MPTVAGYVWLWGVPEVEGGLRSALCELPTRPLLWPRASKRCFRAPESSPSASRPGVPHPSWATTKETAAWRFGA